MKKIWYGIVMLLVLGWACSGGEKGKEQSGGEPQKEARTEESQKKQKAEQGPKAKQPEEQEETSSQKQMEAKAPATETGYATNYYDLPPKEGEKLKEFLGADNLETLEAKNLKVMQDYLEEHVFSGKSKFGRRVSSNYFWYVYNSLPSFVDEMERHKGYYENQGPKVFKKQLMAYGIYRIDRSPENIKRLWSFAKPVLKTVIPMSSYERMGLRRKVNGLINSYEKLERIEDYSVKLEEFYKQTFTPGGALKNKEDAQGAYGLSVHDLNQKIFKYLEGDRHMMGMPSLSFWMRRNHEGNIDTVIEILREIQGMYRVE